MFSSDLVFLFIGGLGCFFYGMQIMSDGLKKIAGKKLKNILHMATKIPVVGIMVGALVTCLMQSSSATTVMVVGFVNAGLLGLKQAICVVMGANIGTTFTAWLVSSMSIFKITSYALPAIGIGFALTKLGRTRKARFWGDVILGFGILFLGLSFLKDAFAPLKDSEQVKNLFIMLSDNPILGVIVGIVFTVLLQSSSATIAIVQVLAFNGVISFTAAVPIILGDNIGTTITAQIAAVGTNLPARRTAMAHTLFNVLGTAYMLIFVYTGWYVKAIELVVPGEITPKNIMFYIAIAHSAFNVVNTIVFIPFIGWLEKASTWLVPKKKGAVEKGVQYLEKHLLNTPPIALEQALNETVWMLGLSTRSVSTAMDSVFEYDKRSSKKISEFEEAIDNLQSEITQYLVDLSGRTLDKDVTEELPVLIHSVNDIERIGDHAENILELGERKLEEKMVFSDDAMNGLRRMWDEVSAMLKETEKALKETDSSIAVGILKREKNVNQMQEDLKKENVTRMSQGVCKAKAGVVFVDLVDNIEKIGDHLANISQGIVGKMRWQSSKVEIFEKVTMLKK